MPLLDAFVPSLRQFHPRRFPYLRFGLTLLFGAGMGWLFQRMGVPLPWMLGPMVGCTLAVLAGVPVSAPAPVRPPMTAVIGVMLGASFSPALLRQLPQWALTLALETALIAVLAVVGVWYYRRVAKLDRVTAYYAGMPGGMMEMSLLGEEQGGDGQAIALIHSARILLIVATVPFLVQGIEHVSLGPRSASALSVVDAPATTFLWLIGLAVVGAIAGRLLRLPARFLFGPMFASIAAHASGLTDFVMPREIVVGAQIMLGCITGCRFLGYDKRAIVRIMLQSMGATALLLAITVAFCFGLVQLVDVSLSRALLAFAPAGIAEMSLVAIALHFDVAFILAHQLARIMLVASLAAPVFRWLGRREKPPGN